MKVFYWVNICITIFIIWFYTQSITRCPALKHILVVVVVDVDDDDDGSGGGGDGGDDEV